MNAKLSNDKTGNDRNRKQGNGMEKTALRLIAGLAAGGIVGFGAAYAIYSARGRLQGTAEAFALMAQENAWILQTAFLRL
ncbi:MAG TPA: hypothetical protein H9717_03770 [Candidatus Eisenbergiella merdipullorum]|uniref:Uncharacterized protein n=1 Tax=Candidatus Eisenbergiella merdipullorum TaxID=2838553 RepID=A0A9D2I5V7_9FIRM|nr:hypothetical protein [Candidatus Eisenbergiella merdipullorum]